MNINDNSSPVLKPFQIMYRLARLLLAFGILLWASSAQAQIVTEFRATSAGDPEGITAGPDGNIWFTVGGAGRIGRITPSGVVTETSSGGGFVWLSAYGITSGPDGNLWFTGGGGIKIGRITPAGVITTFSAGISDKVYPPMGITSGPDGNLWFTEPGINRIGRITPVGVVTEFSSGISGGAYNLSGITAGPDGNIWFTESIGKIGRITPAGIVTEFSAGITTGASPKGITTGPDGNLWFTEPGINRIGRITPAGVVTEFSAGISDNAFYVTGGGSAITAGPDGNIWFTEPRGNRIGRITPSGVVTEFSIGITSNAYPFGITSGPDGNIWFTENWTGRIGRITIAQAAPTTILPGNSSSPGSTLSNLTPQFSWNAAVGATGYGLYIRDVTTDTLVYPNAAGTTSTPLTGTSYQLPSGYLVNGHAYRWAMTSFANSKESGQSAYLYFQTPTIDATADCLFNWAERNLPSLLSPPAISQSVGPYYFRYYSNTNAYLGTSSSDGHLYYVVATVPHDLGLASSWYSTASCAPNTILTLKWPLATSYASRVVTQDFGADWAGGVYCDGLIKKHNGTDFHATAGTAVYAAETGDVKEVLTPSQTGGWASNIVLEHTGPAGGKYTTVYWHVTPESGVVVAATGLPPTSIPKGVKIATVADLTPYGNATHFHFGVRNGTYLANVSGTGALPQTNCGGYPAFPGDFLDPNNVSNVLFQ